MSKRISQMTTEDLKNEMSIAGSPEKVMKAFDEMLSAYYKSVDKTNGAELINFDLAIRRILAENYWMIKEFQKNKPRRF